MGLTRAIRSMAQKESQHRETVDDLEKQLTQVRRQFDDLTALSRDQVSYTLSASVSCKSKLMIWLGSQYVH